MKRCKNTDLKSEVKKKFKCFKCKKEINKPFSDMITLYSVMEASVNSGEYNFCTERCLDGFFRDKIEFRAIVENMSDD